MPLSVTGKGVMCTVYGVWCMVYAVQCCLFVSSRTGFHGHSIPGHLWRRVTAGSVSSGSQGRRDTRRFTAPQEFNRDTQNVEEMPQMSKSSSSQVRLPQDLQGSIIWWLPSAQFMLYMRENYASRIYDSRELDQRFFLTPLQANT